VFPVKYELGFHIPEDDFSIASSSFNPDALLPYVLFDKCFLSMFCLYNVRAHVYITGTTI
jgi:hypothetical protein